MSIELVDKEIPEFSRYYLNDVLEVRRKKDDFLVKVRLSKTSGGDEYPSCKLINDNRKRVAIGFHKVVCLAYHGLPPTELHTDVNHDDGDKENYHPSNLGWMTRSQNVKHAYTTGLRSDAQGVTMFDHVLQQETYFTSLSDVAAWAGLKHKKGWHLVKKHESVKYLARYTFKMSKGYVSPKRKYRKSIRLICPDNNFYLFEDLAQMENITGLNRGTIQHLLSYSDRRCFNGWLFWEEGEEPPNVTKEEVEESKRIYARQKKFTTKTSPTAKVA